MVKLKDVLNTKYITGDHVSELSKALKEHKEIDLVDCKFTSADCELLLRQNYGNVVFRNSGDKVLDNILLHNSIACSDKGNLSTVSIPVDLESQEEVLEFLNNIDKTKIYDLENCRVTGRGGKGNKAKCIALAILITMRFPDVVIDLKEMALDFYRQVRLDWLKYREPHTHYIEVIGNALVEREVVDGKVKLSDTLLVDEHIFTQTHDALPKEFGSVRLVGVPEFKEVWNNAVSVINTEVEEELSMMSYLSTLDNY